MGFCNCSMFCCALLLCNHLDREERAGCFAKLVFLASRYCCVTVPWICLEFVIVFPDYIHLLFVIWFFFSLFIIVPGMIYRMKAITQT